MAPSRLQFDLSFAGGARSAARRSDGPRRLLLLADLGGDRSVPPAQRRPLRVDIDTLAAVFGRIAPRLALPPQGQAAVLHFASLDDFHPDALLATPVFEPLRRLRADIDSGRSLDDAATALGLVRDGAVPAPAPAPAATPGVSDIERLLGRAPTQAAHDPLQQWLKDLVAPHVQAAHEHPDAAALRGALDNATGALMRSLLHHPALQALEAAWRGVERLVRGLDLDGELQLHLLDVGSDELQADLAAHRAALEHSACHRWFKPGDGADAVRWTLLAVDHRFGPAEADVQALAALGALAARAGAPLLANADAALAGAEAHTLAEPARWRPADDGSLAWWQALREATMAPWLGLVLPRVLMRLPYGGATDPVSGWAFEEMPPGMPATERQAAYLWGGGAPALLLLAGQALLQADEGEAADPTGVLDLDDLPSHITDDDGERRQQPCAEWPLGEEAGQALLARGLMPLLSWRQRPAARLLRWQAIASPAQPLSGF
ncbi:type VI secretion system contractile sheath domain-containing protein [Pseudorhodoferax sp.]|uniref:type VI secretion system contractile sheath domain-containing protein n=1 Tax=Pseudorhodoferax sp. TaxID=1993553 RepID=UPI002DD6398C|nr:type VI secretion system contractile sheath large subunit [Pseudorhodoferax sp.]